MEIYFSLYFLVASFAPSSSLPPTSSSFTSFFYFTIHPSTAKQIEKRDCFEIHGASQVPTVPFGFPFCSPPPHPSSYVPLLFVKEITFFFSLVEEKLMVWAFVFPPPPPHLHLLPLSIRFLWVFYVGGKKRVEDKFQSMGNEESGALFERKKEGRTRKSLKFFSPPSPSSSSSSSSSNRFFKRLRKTLGVWTGGEGGERIFVIK